MTASSFRVIVVGASVAGLTLAHCLDQAGIDYLVLEKHHSVDDTPLGGFLAIQPNGARVLAQLGLYDAVLAAGQPISVCHMGNPDGSEFSDCWPARMAERLGFPLSVLRRQELLHFLYSSLKDQSRIQTNRKVVRISQTDSGVSIWTDDGSVYHGDTVVGADGVHSVTRSELWSLANNKHPGLIPPAEQTSLAADYSAVVGMSAGVPGLQGGEQVIRMHDDLTIFLFGGKAATGWIVMQKLDQKYTYPNGPRFTQDDAVEACKPLLDLPVWRDIKFGDVWDRKDSFAMVTLDEAILRHWHYGRIVCIGDSVNKMTPNFGQGANTAIEHAAALANALHKLTANQRPQTEKLSETDVTNALGKVAQKHLAHMNTINEAAWFITRMHARQGWTKTFVSRYVFPKMGRLLTPYLAWMFADSVLLEYVPPPASSTGQAATGAGQSKWSWAKGPTVMVGWIVVILGISVWLGAF